MEVAIIVAFCVLSASPSFNVGAVAPSAVSFNKVLPVEFLISNSPSVAVALTVYLSAAAPFKESVYVSVCFAAPFAHEDVKVTDAP